MALQLTSVWPESDGIKVQYIKERRGREKTDAATPWAAEADKGKESARRHSSAISGRSCCVFHTRAGSLASCIHLHTPRKLQPAPSPVCRRCTYGEASPVQEVLNTQRSALTELRRLLNDWKCHKYRWALSLLLRYDCMADLLGY